MTKREAIDKALKKHETNCCMFERGVQTLDDLLASRTVFLGVLQAAQAQAAEPTIQEAIDAGDGCLHSTIDSLQDKVAQQQAAMYQSVMYLKAIRTTLIEANQQIDGPITDTIWYSEYETLFDFIDAAIAALEKELK